MDYNIDKLTQELEDAGILDADAVSSDGKVWDKDLKEIHERADVRSVLLVHDPTPSPAELQKSAETDAAKLDALWELAVNGDATKLDALKTAISHIKAE